MNISHGHLNNKMFCQEVAKIDPILELAILYLYSMLQLTLTSPRNSHARGGDSGQITSHAYCAE